MIEAHAYPSEDIPGLWNVQMPDGEWLRDMTTGQLWSLGIHGRDVAIAALTADRDRYREALERIANEQNNFDAYWLKSCARAALDGDQ